MGFSGTSSLVVRMGRVAIMSRPVLVVYGLVGGGVNSRGSYR